MRCFEKMDILTVIPEPNGDRDGTGWAGAVLQTQSIGADAMTVSDRAACELLCALANDHSAATVTKVDQLAARVRDWDALLRMAKEHSMLPQLYLRVTEAGADIPPNVRERLHSEYQSNLFHSLANAAELISILKSFDAAGMRAIPFKGVVLAASVYGDLETRPAGDLDILIDLRDRQRATALLLQSGYELRTPVHQDGTPVDPQTYEYHFERPTDGMVTELRWRFDLTSSRFRHDLGMDWVWPHRQTTMLAGAEVPDLDPGTTLLILCMHGCKHQWTRLLWICDVGQLLTSRSGLDWRTVTREAGRTGLWRCLALGVLLAHRMTGCEVPPSVLHRFQSDRAAARLARHFEDHLFDAPGSIPEGLLPYNIQLLGLRDRMSLLLSLDFLRPNDRDLAVLNLPKGLHGLYYLIRPFRILRDRSPR
jgi:hypothetical protein